jgi:hypothetical protein
MKHTPVPDKLRVLILYADRTSGHEAKRACDRVLNELHQAETDREHWLEFRLWRMDLLEHPDIRAQASREVAAADLIVVTVDDNRGLSESFRLWAQSWPVPRPVSPRALVAFHTGEAIGAISASPTAEFLRQLAEQKGMHLVSDHSSAASVVHPLPVESTEAQEEAPVPGATAGPRDPLAFPQSEGRHLGFRHCGINE